MASLTHWTWVWANKPRETVEERSPVCCRPWGGRLGQDLVTQQQQQRDGQENQPQAHFRVTCRGPWSVAGASFSFSIFFRWSKASSCRRVCLMLPLTTAPAPASLGRCTLEASSQALSYLAIPKPGVVCLYTHTHTHTHKRRHTCTQTQDLLHRKT